MIHIEFFYIKCSTILAVVSSNPRTDSARGAVLRQAVRHCAQLSGQVWSDVAAMTQSDGCSFPSRLGGNPWDIACRWQALRPGPGTPTGPAGRTAHHTRKGRWHASTETQPGQVWPAMVLDARGQSAAQLPPDSAVTAGRVPACHVRMQPQRAERFLCPRPPGPHDGLR
jgi:hypothetical protein